ncbi:1169_t:CDS:2 [Ambispora leptoticha]|uniref:1169_t:CDS:1 n=1 Tax=Ambispora leptoticha TaxID=144679 RepID=A0A9N8V831_9GLOM|nr:1169_t:CDS:2 [Ambispora leptoticha]
MIDHHKISPSNVKSNKLNFLQIQLAMVRQHVIAVPVSINNKVDLAIGSSMQIVFSLLFFLVILGWIMDIPMTLLFDMSQGWHLAMAKNFFGHWNQPRSTVKISSQNSIDGCANSDTQSSINVTDI